MFFDQFFIFIDMLFRQTVPLNLKENILNTPVSMLVKLLLV